MQIIHFNELHTEISSTIHILRFKLFMIIIHDRNHIDYYKYYSYDTNIALNSSSVIDKIFVSIALR